MNCKTILIVEDDQSIRETLVALLQSEGYPVTAAVDGKDALRQLDSFKEKRVPCLILTDLMMPNMSGWELIERIDNDVVLALIPLVVMSAGKDAPADKHFIRKPANLDTILKAVHDNCGPPNPTK